MSCFFKPIFATFIVLQTCIIYQDVWSFAGEWGRGHQSQGKKMMCGMALYDSWQHSGVSEDWLRSKKKSCFLLQWSWLTSSFQKWNSRVAADAGGGELWSRPRLKRPKWPKLIRVQQWCQSSSVDSLRTHGMTSLQWQSNEPWKLHSSLVTCSNATFALLLLLLPSFLEGM